MVQSGPTVATPGAPTTCSPFMNHIATVPLLVSRQRMSLMTSALKSDGPAIIQLAGTAPGEPLCKTESPFISQIATVPVLLSRQSKSYLPSLLKSRWPTSCQLVGTWPKPADCD